jgi:hypothetical protein
MVTGDIVAADARWCRGIRRALEAIVMRALATDPAQRYQSAGLMLEAIERYAQQAGVALTGVAIARFMGELFGVVPEPWLRKHAPVTAAMLAPRQEGTNSNVDRAISGAIGDGLAGGVSHDAPTSFRDIKQVAAIAPQVGVDPGRRRARRGAQHRRRSAGVGAHEVVSVGSPADKCRRIRPRRWRGCSRPPRRRRRWRPRRQPRPRRRGLERRPRRRCFRWSRVGARARSAPVVARVDVADHAHAGVAGEHALEAARGASVPSATTTMAGVQE